MPKHLLRRYLPDPEQLIRHRSLRFLGQRLADPSLWHLNRRSAAGAMFWGLFCAMLPLPLQMLLAAALALLFRTHLALTVVMVWISNPLTLLPLAWLAYAIGSLLLGQPMLAGAEFRLLLGDISSLLASPLQDHSAVLARLSGHARPFLLGTLGLSLLSGSLGYVLMRLYWRWHVLHAWEKRRQQRARTV